MVGVTVPLHACEHMYIVTEPMEGVPRDLPVMRDPDGYIYFKEEVGGLLMGGFEPVAKPWGKDGIPDDFAFGMLPEDWDQFQILMDNALIRVPALETAGIKTLHERPGELHARPPLHPRRGARAARASSSARASTRWASPARAAPAWRWPSGSSAGEPTLDLWPVDIRRFAPFHGNDALAARARSPRRWACTTRWRGRNASTRAARPFRRSPLYDRLTARGAWFGNKMGWERANWFAGAGKTPDIAIRLGPRQNWFDAVAAEHRAAREAVTVFDQTSFGKLLLAGPRRRGGAAAALRQRRRRAVGPHGLHAACSTSAAASRATSPSRGWRATHS